MCWFSSAPTSLPIEPSGPGPPTVAEARGTLGGQPLGLGPQPQLCQPVPQHRRLQIRPRGPQRNGVGDGARPSSAAAGAERAALVHQRRHRHPPAVADRAEPVRVGDAGVGHVDLVELRLAGHLAQRPGLDTGSVHVDDEVGQALVLGHVRIAARQQQAPAGAMRQAGPHLLPVDDPVVAVGHRRGGQPGEVGAGAGFGEQLTPDVLGGGQRAQQLPFHLVGLRVLAHRRRRHPVPHRVQRQRHRAARPLQDSVGDGLQAARDPEAAEAFGKVHPGQPGVVTGAEELGDGDGLRVVFCHDLSGEIGDAIRVGNGAHSATIGNARLRLWAGGPLCGSLSGRWVLSRRCH